MILRFLLWRLITRWLPGQVEAVFLCKVWSSMGIWFSYNVYPKFYRKCVTFGPSLSVISPDFLWCLSSEFSNCSLTEQTCKNVPRHLKLGKYWPISLTGMKPSFGFCYIYSPGLGTKWSLRKDIKTVFKWGPPKQSKVLVTSHKIYK